MVTVTKENRISDQFIIRFITSLGSYKSHQGVIHEGAYSFMNRHPFPLVHINTVVQTINQYNNSFPQSFLSFTLQHVISHLYTWRWAQDATVENSSSSYDKKESEQGPNGPLVPEKTKALKGELTGVAHRISSRKL